MWFALIASSFFLPLLRYQRLERMRRTLLRRLEKARHSRVITLIHRQEAVSFLGIPIARYINIEDSEQVLRAIRLTPPDLPIDLILHTPGGLVLAAEQIALAIKRHRGKVTVFVPHYAMSGGTMLALAADEIVMDENAVMGPVDPQIGSYPASSILRVLRTKRPADIDDQTMILADVAEKAVAQVRDTVLSILRDTMEEAKAAEVAEALTEGRWTHDYPLTYAQLEYLGLPVKLGLPREVYDLMELYPQPPQRRPSVQYIPVPYRDGEKRDK
ncbi:MAG: ATP-dependent Clp protease proteolytic subunit [Firmicutes bacterium]|jgi:ClpP class serine protease|nr:ATP-dependent Clp protease proteolytic subunit [Bacillota bacterium]